jgi:hypothetical protein
MKTAVRVGLTLAAAFALLMTVPDCALRGGSTDACEIGKGFALIVSPMIFLVCCGLGALSRRSQVKRGKKIE